MSMDSAGKELLLAIGIVFQDSWRSENGFAIKDKTIYVVVEILLVESAGK